VLSAVVASFGACGATPPPPASNPTAATDTAAPAPASSAATPPSKPAGDEQGKAKKPDSTKPIPAGPAADAMETFPSGLTVDAKLIGGPPPGPELPKGTRILHVGDSFAGALGVELKKVFEAAGLESRLEFEKSTYIPTWAHSPKLQNVLRKYRPDLVLISLGANELEIPEPEKRAPLIQKLVKSLGETPCVWVAPVLWEGAKSSLLDVIRANVGSCVYLDSNRLVTKMPRAGDKIHPSMAARPDWAAATARWLAYHRKPTESKAWNISPTP
jgi:hypothetical protein